MPLTTKFKGKSQKKN